MEVEVLDVVESFPSLREALKVTCKQGFWLSVDVYNKALEAAKSIAERKEGNGELSATFMRV